MCIYIYTGSPCCPKVQWCSVPMKSFTSQSGIKQRSNYLRIHLVNGCQNNLDKAQMITDIVQSYAGLMLNVILGKGAGNQKIPASTFC